MSIEKKRCFMCGIYTYTERHHIFNGVANRKKSEEDGLVVDLCPDCHRTSKYAVHNCREMMLNLKKYGQKEYEKTHTREEFMKRYGKNYLTED